MVKDITKDDETTTLTLGELGTLQNNLTDEYYLVIDVEEQLIPQILDYYTFAKRFQFRNKITVEFRDLKEI